MLGSISAERVGAVGPDLLGDVGLIKELLELLAVVDAGVGRVPLTDDLVRLSRQSAASIRNVDLPHLL